MRRVMIGVMGGGDRATPRAVDQARRLGTLIAEEGWVLLSGGRAAGVMDAVGRGAREAGGLVVGILPGDDGAEASEHLDIAIVTGMGSARNNINVLSSDVVVACGDLGPGTLSEVALAVKAGKAVVLLTDDEEARSFLTRVGSGLVRAVSTPEEAVGVVRATLERSRED